MTETQSTETKQPDAPAGNEDPIDLLIAALTRIEIKLDTIFDVLTADEDEEIQLTLDDQDPRREGEQGNGLG